MRTGIAKKLLITYIIIITSVLVSGGFGLYVLNINLNTNNEMRQVTMPSLDHLKDMRQLMQEIKKLSASWVFVSNNRDHARLRQALSEDYRQLDSSIRADYASWKGDEEVRLAGQLVANNRRVIDTVIGIMKLLVTPSDYLDDARTENATELDAAVARLIGVNDTLYEKLIVLKENRLSRQQEQLNSLLLSMFFIVSITILIVVVTSWLSIRYSQRNIAKPLIDLRQTAADLATGEIANLAGVRPVDEIGEIYDAMNQMVNGIREKIAFAEEIGKGNYNATFTPLSSLDKLGSALLAMRRDLIASNEALMEQDRTLLDAQRLARLGNFFYDLRTLKFQTSTTLNDILGIDVTFGRRNVDWRNHILPEFHERMAKAAVHAIKTRSKFNQSCIVRRNNDGKECWVNIIAEYNYDEFDRATSMFGTLQDVSESKRLELDLNRSYQVASEQNNRLLNFSYIVSHNLRMHSVNIQSLLNLYAETDNEEERKEYISYMHIASDQLNETLFQLNEVVAMQNSLKLSLQPVPLRQAIEHTVDLLISAINEKQAVVVNNVSDSIVINYNSVYMDSILLNFVSNAIKYSHPGRKPVVTISCYKEQEEKENSRWVLEIADNGRGIDLDLHRDKLFGMYKTFHGNSDAKGIGLFMTKYQVEAMGGDILVESKVGEGTTFKVLIR